jgi:putative flippase GtrA
MNKALQRSIGFFINSGFTGVVYIAILFISDSLFHVKYFVGVTLAYVVSMTYYFIFNKRAIFKTESTSRTNRNEIVSFAVLLIINYLITVLIVGIISHFTKENYSGSLVAGILTITLTYFVFEKIIFKKKG